MPALYLLAAIVGAVIARPSFPDNTAKTRQVLLISGPIHYDILVPLDAMSIARFTPLAESGVWLDHPAARWLVIGWGARDFYTQTPTYRDLNLNAIWRGITGDQSVLRFDIAGDLPADLSARRLNLTESQYAALLDSIWSSLGLGPDGQPERLKVEGYTQTDGFFAATGQFNILRTCNVWIGEQLRAAGLRFGVWTPMPLSISLSFDLYQGK